MFSVGDILVPTFNNAEALDEPVPYYRILQIGMGRVIAENTETKEMTDLTAGKEKLLDCYYEKYNAIKHT